MEVVIGYNLQTYVNQQISQCCMSKSAVPEQEEVASDMLISVSGSEVHRMSTTQVPLIIEQHKKCELCSYIFSLECDV